MEGIKITVEHYDRKYEISTNAERCDEVLDMFLGLMTMLGFSGMNIIDAILDKSEEYIDEEDIKDSAVVESDIDRLNKMWGNDAKKKT